MENPSSVSLREPRARLADDAESEHRIEAALILEHGREIGAAQKLEDDVHALVLAARIEHLRDVSALELTGSPRFAKEALVRECGRDGIQHFHRDTSPGHPVLPFVHDARGSAPELGEELVLHEVGGRRERDDRKNSPSTNGAGAEWFRCFEVCYERSPARLAERSW